MPEFFTKAYCSDCGGDRNHDILHSETVNGSDTLPSDDDGGTRPAWYDTYETLKCRGCDSVRLRHTSWHFLDEEERVSLYPPPIARREPEWRWRLIHYTAAVSPIRALLKEIYTALQNDSPRLAGMGVRALLEHVMIEKTGDHGSFADNVTQFFEQGYISSRQAKTLAAILEAGHATIHRGWCPGKDDLNALLDITESIIETVYLHEGQAEQLTKKVPPRKS